MHTLFPCMEASFARACAAPSTLRSGLCPDSHSLPGRGEAGKPALSPQHTQPLASHRGGADQGNFSVPTGEKPADPTIPTHLGTQEPRELQWFAPNGGVSVKSSGLGCENGPLKTTPSLTTCHEFSFPSLGFWTLARESVKTLAPQASEAWVRQPSDMLCAGPAHGRHAAPSGRSASVCPIPELSIRIHRRPWCSLLPLAEFSRAGAAHFTPFTLRAHLEVHAASSGCT